MICPNCGTELKDGVLVCESCGTEIKATDSPVSETPAAAPEAPAKKKKKDTSKSGKSGGSKKTLKAVIICLAVLAVLAAGFFGIRALMDRSAGNNTYTYLSAGKFNMISDVEKGESFEFDSLGEDYDYYGPVVQYSPDGNYMYYLSDYDTETSSGTLKRAEWKKLSDSSVKNGRYIDKVDTGVYSDFAVLDSGKLIYVKNDGSLNVYDGRKSEEIAQTIYDYYLDSTDRVVYTKDTDAGLSVYGVDLSAPDKSELWGKGVTYVYPTNDLDHVLYSAYDDDNSEVVRVAGFDGEAMSLKLGEENSLVTYTDDAFYYMTVSDSASLYEFVKDVSGEDGETNLPPIKSDFIVADSFSYHNMKPGDKVTDYGKIYTTITKASTFFASRGGTMEKAAENDTTDGKLLENFVSKFRNKEGEEGYFQVTDEVRNELVKIAEALSDGSQGRWLEMCFYKQADGESYVDEEAYNKAMDLFYAINNRNSVRDNLMDEINNVPLYSLMRYDYESKKSETMVDEILYAKAFFNSVMYKTRTAELESIDINDLLSYWDVYDMMTMDFGEDNMLYSISDDTVYTVTGDAADVLGTEQYAGTFDIISADGGVLLYAMGGIYKAEINDTEITGFELLSKDGIIVSADNDAVYFGENYKTRGSLSYMDLKAMISGEIQTVAEDIMTDTVNIYEDGVVMANTNYTSGQGYELSVYNTDGTSRVIAEGVGSYLRVNADTVLYISGNDLYLYNGAKPIKLGTGVENVWSSEVVPIKKSVSGYNDYIYET